jgi:O-antigen ligase
LFSFLFLVAQILFGSGISLSKSENINVAGGETIRFPSFFQDPQKYAQYLAMTGLLMFIPIENDKNWSIIMKLLPYATIVAILITGSRAALGGMFIGLAYIYLKKGRALFFIIISFIMAIIVMTVGKNLPVFKRASLSESYDFRNNIWNDAIEIYKIHPIWGIGAGNYSEYVRIHHPDQYWMGDNEMIFFDHPESGYLKWLIEFGTIGFLAFLSLILIPLIRSFFIRHNESCSILAATLISWLIGFYTLYSLGDLRIGIVVAVTTTLLMAENIISKNESLIRRKPFY